MEKSFALTTVIIMLIVATLACSLPGAATPAPDSGDAVATSVAATLTALAPVPATATVPAPTEAASVLPRVLYLLARDVSGLPQLYRLERDGVTLTQLTNEPGGINDYDVAADGRIAYVTTENQLLLINADGSGRRVLVEGGGLGDGAPYSKRIFSPVWALDGSTLAYHLDGLSFYDLSTGTSSLALADQEDNTSGFNILNEGYVPRTYSPDDKKLLIDVQFYEAGSKAIYDVATRTLTRFSSPSGGIICCTAAWTPDSANILMASQFIGMIESGLWRYNASDGNGVTLLPSTAADGTYNYVEAPTLGPDGNLYFFFANRADISNTNVALNMVRAAADGVTSRANLRLEAYQLNEALWAPDASFALVVQNVSPGDIFGPLFLVPANSNPILSLPVANARMLKWGR